ncbi:MAG: filamentous hemagglutinin N-terminal domain-containing protein, partial [Burkholderiales bacterium]|nr:filamentous hemagglutinin N-terminal domain-containing protein [Burkholderiales bacterium]
MNTERALIYLLRRKALAVAVAACFAAPAQANPNNPTVISGAATFAVSGKSLNVTNTPGAVINWQGFSVSTEEVTRFIQQNAQSAVLNRVTGQEVSAILGQLQSNGRVYLINPNGITIGAGARVDTAGFVASSLNLSDSDALAGKFKLQDIGGSGKVINNGTITTTSGGFVYLVAPDVENNGVITSPKGEIILAAGKSVELVDSQKPELRVELTAPENTAVNVGKLIAEAGTIGIFAGAIRQSGQISANSVVMGENGKIFLKAKKDITLTAGSKTEASGPQGGEITIQSEAGSATIAGVVEANGTQGKGGTISVTAPVAVTIEPTARVSADGIEGGSVTLSSSAGSVSVSAPVTAKATSGKAGQIAVNAATTAVISAGQLSASGGMGGGAISVKGVEGVTLDAPSSAQASGAAGGTVSIAADQGSVVMQGTIDVTGIDGLGGKVQLTALSDITIDIAGKILASGRSGGEVYIESGQGTLLSSGLIDGQGSDGQGGRVLLLAPRVGLI